MLRLFLKYSLGSWIAASLSIFTLPIVTALIRPDEFGKAAMFTLAVGLCSQIAQLGCDQSYVREFYVDRGHSSPRGRLLFSCLAGPLIASALVVVGCLVIPEEISRLVIGHSDPAFAFLLAAAIPLAVVERFSTLTIRLEQRALTYSMLRVLLAAVTFAATLVYALTVKADFAALAIAQVAGIAAVTLAGVLLGRSTWRFLNFDSKQAAAALRYGLPFIPAFGAAWLFEGADKIMLRTLSDFNEVGIFSAGYRFVTLITLVTASFTTFWVPVTYELFERDPDEARRLGSRAVAGMTGLLLLAGCGVLLIREIVILVFASDYRASLAVMPFLLFVPIIYTLSEVTVGGINYAKRPGWHLGIALVAAAVNLALNAALIPFWGARGAAAATAVSYILFFFLRTVIGQHYLPLSIGWTRMVVGVALFAIACLSATFWPTGFIAYAVTVAVAAIIAWLYRNELDEALAKVRP